MTAPQDGPPNAADEGAGNTPVHISSVFAGIVGRQCAALGMDVDRTAEFLNPDGPQPTSLCPHCGATLYHRSLGEFGWNPLPTPCSNPECVEKDREEREKRERREQLIELEKKLPRSGVPALYLHARLNNMELVNSSFTAARDKVVDYLQHLTDRCSEGAGLFLHGPVGSGKTHMAVAVLRESLRREHTGRFIQSCDLIGKIQATMNNRESTQEIMAEYQNCTVLVLDDIGKEYATDWALNQLSNLIGARYVSRRPTIYTSNFTLDELTDKLAVRGNTDSAQAIVSRIRGSAYPVKVVAKDYRAKIR